MWEHLQRGGVTLRNYGEGFEFAGVEEGEDEERTGAREVANIPMPAAIWENTSRDYPIFNMNIPDNYRTEWFEREIRERYLSGKHSFPSFVNVTLCNDHGTAPNPKRGYPYRASWMADNDLALGRMVEFLSHTPQWRHMLILVTEDDAGGELDHVDAQRGVLLAIGPYVRRGYVSHRHTTITSMHRTLYEIFGLPPAQPLRRGGERLQRLLHREPGPDALRRRADRPAPLRLAARAGPEGPRLPARSEDADDRARRLRPPGAAAVTRNPAADVPGLTEP